MNRNELLRRFPNASAATIRRNQDSPDRVCPADPKPTEGNALVRPVPGEKASGSLPIDRYRIQFVIYSVRPCDWDGYHVKELQDMLCHAAIILGDEWFALEGSVRSEKVHSKEEERTEIVISKTPA